MKMLYNVGNYLMDERHVSNQAIAQLVEKLTKFCEGWEFGCFFTNVHHWLLSQINVIPCTVNVSH
jgi:hypothetical protein